MNHQKLGGSGRNLSEQAYCGTPEEVSASSQEAVTGHLHTQPAPHEGPVSRMSGKLLRPGHGWR